MSQNPSALLLEWYDSVKRDLPWRRTKDPYRIWLSEIMLQQTRVETVKGYYARFLERCPTVEALANAPEETVLKLWEGLGYYSRARNLQKAAKTIVHELGGVFPSDYESILKLSGIGPYTAGAVASIAFGQAVPAVDGNVYRVASRFFGIREDVGIPAVQKQIRQLVRESIPTDRPGDYNQALMELGATLCSPHRPDCAACPWQLHCDACREGDQDSLPVHEKKQAPKAVDVAVCLLTCGDRVLVLPRQERMLKGLYVFWLTEEETAPEKVEQLLREDGLPCAFTAHLGEAKHVFTHRVWNMQLLHYTLETPPDDAWMAKHSAKLVTAPELAALPLPTAVKAARAAAMELLGGMPAAE
ncbi:MAG: A/G-specific adenine glycosylase [Clostridia bacterium]|nr:A/G-specific adenine glycosylase [Clostridia bacterium]